MSMVFGSPGLGAAAPAPSIVSAVVEKPIVSVDGIATQKAVVVVEAPGGLSQIQDVTLTVNTPDLPGSSVGSFTWSPTVGFIENNGPTDGSEYVNLIPDDPRHPDTTSKVVLTDMVVEGEGICAQAGPTLGSAAGFNVYTLGNFTGTSGSVGGKVAVGGKLDVKSYSLASSLPAGSGTVVSGGDVAVMKSGQVSGGATQIAGTCTVTSFGHPQGPLTCNDASTFDAGNTVSEMNTIADGLTALDNTDCTVTAQPWGSVSITSAVSPAVCDLDLNAVSAAFSPSVWNKWINGITINAPGEVLINVTGNTAIWGRTGSFNLTGGTSASKILWNFDDATNLTISNVAAKGTVFAPKATVNFTSGSLNGSIVANAITGTSSNFQNAPFNGSICGANDLPAPDAKVATITFIWTLDRSLGSTFDNDATVTLNQHTFALQSLFTNKALAADEVVVDSSFDTNTPPDVTPISDLPVEVSDTQPGDVDITVSAVDIDSDPIAYAMIEGPTDGSFNVDTFSWEPTIEDLGSQNVQIIAVDPYGVTAVDFDVIVELPPIPESGSWTLTNQVDAPVARIDHSVVWDGGDQTLIWGGTVDDGSRSSTGAIYHQATDTWTPITSALNDAAASQHVAVWTGSEMLIWGGLDMNNQATNEGQLYDPVTDTWRQMSTDGAPSPRYEAAGVWTGSKLFVWGGVSVTSGVSTWYNDGAMYDVATDTWTPVGAVSLNARQSAGAVLSNLGQSVMVWGGVSWSPVDGTFYYTDGGVYDLATDTWVTVDTTGFIEGRSGHAMVPISDTVVAMWGGVYNGGLLNNGIKYDLVTQSWLPISADKAPSARSSFAFAGKEGKLVIWGGHDGVDVMGTGGVYDSDSDSWTATSTVASPTPAQGAVGVMENGTAYFWGGLGAGAVLQNVGGIFSP